MSEKNEQIFENEEFQLLLRKYESMKDADNSLFFDVEEFEQIIDYYLDEFEYENAARAAELGKKQHPASVELKYKVVHIYLEQGMGKQALEMLDHLPSWEYANAEFFYLKGTALCITGKIKEAEKNFDRGLELSSDDQFEALLNIAIAFENARQFRYAIKYLEQAHALNPGFLSVIYDLGYFNERLDNFKKSVEYYQEYLDIDPFSENVWYNLGVAYYKLGRPYKAIEAYDFSLAINPEYASAFFNKASIFSGMGEYDDAIETISEFLELEAENQQALNFLADCYEQKGDYRKALETFKKVIELDNTDPDAWYGAGMVYYQVARYDEAVIYMLKALEFDGQNTDYWINLGFIYEESGKKDEAIKCFGQVIKIDPTDDEAWLSLASLLIEIKDPEGALIRLREAVTRFPDDVRFKTRLAVAHFMMGNNKAGTKFLELAISRDKKQIQEFKELFDQSHWSKAIRTLISKYKN